MIHASEYKLKCFPFGSSILSANIDRVQDMTVTDAFNRTKIEEVSRSGLVDWRKSTPNVSLSIRQLEYGSLEFYRRLANVEDTDNKIEFTDFKTPMIDIVGYKTDDSGTFLGTAWYPKFRATGFSLSAGDPDAILERNINLIGEDDIVWQNDNKYLIPLSKTCESGETGDVTITIGSGDYSTYPDPILDPDTSGTYLLRVVRIRSGTATEMDAGSSSGEYEYNSGTQVVTFHGALVDDVYKLYYTATTYITAGTIFTLNDVDLAGITADSISIFLETSNYLYRLQNASLDISFDRFDIGELGTQDTVARGIRDVTATTTLGRILENYTLEEVIRGQAGTDYGKLDIKQFTDELNLIIKVYEDSTKSTFKLGYKITDLAPSGIDAGTPVNDYVTRGTTLEGESGFVTATESDLA